MFMLISDEHDKHVLAINLEMPSIVSIIKIFIRTNNNVMFHFYVFHKKSVMLK